MLISAVLVVLLGCYPAPLVDGSNAASQSARIDAAHPAKGVANAGVTEKARLSAE
jgi:hypothetical protein